MMKKSQVTIYCDGACLGNPGPGGYAALLIYNQIERVVAGFSKDTTNNKMELTAAIEGLLALKRPCKVTIYCDSQYVVKGITEWIFSWQENGFKNARKQPIANHDLWQKLALLNSKHDISWIWVKAHAGNELNERVDEIAKEQAMLAKYEP